VNQGGRISPRHFFKEEKKLAEDKKSPLGKNGATNFNCVGSAVSCTTSTTHDKTRGGPTDIWGGHKKKVRRKKRRWGDPGKLPAQKKIRKGSLLEYLLKNTRNGGFKHAKKKMTGGTDVKNLSNKNKGKGRKWDTKKKVRQGGGFLRQNCKSETSKPKETEKRDPDSRQGKTWGKKKWFVEKKNSGHL